MVWTRCTDDDRYKNAILADKGSPMITRSETYVLSEHMDGKIRKLAPERLLPVLTVDGNSAVFRHVCWLYIKRDSADTGGEMR